MQITRSNSTATGPDGSFTGTVYIDTAAAPSEPSRLGVPSVHFMTHMALQEADEEYIAAPPIDG